MNPVEIADTMDWNRSTAGHSNQGSELTKVDVDEPTWRFDSDFELQNQTIEENHSQDPSTNELIGSIVEIETSKTTQRFRLKKFLGSGGMGNVFSASPLTDHQTANQANLAVKILKSGLVATDAHKRFENERDILANLSHENVVRLLGRGKDSLNRPLIAMELLDEITLTEYCESTNISSRDRLRLFLDVCNAVAHCHQRNVIHRDLKPANILTHFDGEHVRAKLIDFGVALTTEPRKLGDKTRSDLDVAGTCSNHSQPAETPKELLVGTLQYMSPEQTGSSGNDIDQRSDVYSLGVILYELLTGEPPVTKRAVMRKTISEIIDQVRFSEHRPVSQIATEVDDLQGDYGQAIDLIVEKCLEKDRNERFGNVGQLIRFLNLALSSPKIAVDELNSLPISRADSGVRSKSPTSAINPKLFTKRLRRVAEQHFWKAISACLLVTLLISGFGSRRDAPNPNKGSKIQLPPIGHSVVSGADLYRSENNEQNFEIQLFQTIDETAELPSTKSMVQMVVVEANSDENSILVNAAECCDDESIRPLIDANPKQLLIQAPCDTFHYVTRNNSPAQSKMDSLHRSKLNCNPNENPGVYLIKESRHLISESRQATIENLSKAIESVANSEPVHRLNVLLSPIPTELQTKLERYHCENEWYSY